jgi:hypothetical protein
LPISIQVIKEMTGGGVDYSFECIGSTSVMAEAFESSRTVRSNGSCRVAYICYSPSDQLTMSGLFRTLSLTDNPARWVQGWGKTIILGTDTAAAPVSISSSAIKRGRSVTGALLGGIKPKDDIPVLAQKCLDKVADHQTHDFPSMAGVDRISIMRFVLLMLLTFFPGAGAGRVRDAPDGLRRHQPRVRPARAGEVPPLHHLDGRRRAEEGRRVTPPPPRSRTHGMDSPT